MKKRTETREIINNINELNEEYGNNFGTKLHIFLIILGIVYAFTVLGIMYLIQLKESNEEFILDSDKKYTIYMTIPQQDLYYYEVDFDKNKVVERRDSEKMRREKMRSIRVDFRELEEFIEEIKSDESNTSISEEEKVALFKQHILRIYKIKDYTQREYFVKNKDQVERLTKILK